MGSCAGCPRERVWSSGVEAVAINTGKSCNGQYVNGSTSLIPRNEGGERGSLLTD